MRKQTRVWYSKEKCEKEESGGPFFMVTQNFYLFHLTLCMEGLLSYHCDTILAYFFVFDVSGWDLTIDWSTLKHCILVKK